jgi:predicted Zn-dependent protease
MIFKKLSIFISCLCLLTLLSANDARIKELTKQIEEGKKIGNVYSNSIVDSYWELVDIYEKQKQKDTAYALILEGLQLDPWNFTYQLKAAEYEYAKKDYNKAYTRVVFLENNAFEDTEIKEKAQTLKTSLLEKIDTKDRAELSPQLPDYYLYVVAYPKVNTFITKIVTNKVAEAYGIQVKTFDLSQAEDEKNMRNRSKQYIEDYANDIIQNNTEEVIQDFLDEIELSRKTLDSFDGKKTFLFELLMRSGDSDTWKQILSIPGQYDANALLAQLEKENRTLLNEKYCLGILGITSEDIFQNDYNFLFGLAKKKVGVISDARFNASTNNFSLYIKRTVMQALSSAGFVIDIPRCTTANCSRAYPNSLEEQDRKEAYLCDECLENLQNRYEEILKGF